MFRITIRGDADDETVLCTKNQTYEVKAADTSNTLLLLPNLLTPKSQGNKEINGNVNDGMMPLCLILSSYKVIDLMNIGSIMYLSYN